MRQDILVRTSCAAGVARSGGCLTSCARTVACSQLVARVPALGTVLDPVFETRALADSTCINISCGARLRELLQVVRIRCLHDVLCVQHHERLPKDIFAGGLNRNRLQWR